MPFQPSTAELEALFAEYGDYHRSALNRAAHVAGLPAMLAGAFGLAHAASPALAIALLVVFSLTNFLVETRLALAAAAFATLLWAAGTMLAPIPAAALLAAGSAIPIATHVLVERRWPDTAARFARFERVGHLWFLNLLVRAVSTTARA